MSSHVSTLTYSIKLHTSSDLDPLSSSLMFRLIKPILNQLRKTQLTIPAPFVEVTKRAEDEFMSDIRTEMKKKVWEKNGGVVSLKVRFHLLGMSAKLCSLAHVCRVGMLTPRLDFATFVPFPLSLPSNFV